MLRILVVDDEPDIRLLVRGLLGPRPDVEIVGEAEDGPSGVEAWRRLRPDAVVLDLRMPGYDGLEVARQILAEEPAAIIVLLSAFLNDETLADARSLGVLACMSKTDIFTLPERLVALAS